MFIHIFYSVFILQILLPKVPKQNTADISEHGAVQYAVDILDNVEVEKAEDMKTTIRTTTADTDIEGANISR